MSEHVKETGKSFVTTKDSNGGTQQGLFQKVYKASDGKDFLIEAERDVHEAELESSYFYLVRFDPDLESVGYSRKQACIQIIGAKDLREADLLLRYHLYNILGNEVTITNNSKLVLSWSYFSVSLSNYIDTLCGLLPRSKSYNGVIRGLHLEKSFID